MLRAGRRPASDWTSEVSSSYALAGFLFAVFIGFTLLVMGPWIGIDAFFNVRRPPDGWLPVLHVLDRIGQRAVCLPILGAVDGLAGELEPVLEVGEPGDVTVACLRRVVDGLPQPLGFVVAERAVELSWPSSSATAAIAASDSWSLASVTSTVALA